LHRHFKPLCIAAHPTLPYFVTGETSGRMQLWKFDETPTSSIQWATDPIVGVSFNATGDRILMTTTNGNIFVNDANSSNLISTVQGSVAAWLNYDTQLIVCEPRHRKLQIYDLVSGVVPVASFALSKYATVATLAVSGAQVVSGCDDGSVDVLDIISGARQGLALHKTAVSALRYDHGGQFFMCGAAENRIKIVNVNLEADVEETGNLFSDYCPNAADKGILGFATAKQTIAACGYSGNVRVWNVSDPRALLR
jgi:WD40 repeat protein